jgi:hypothetical protein
MHGLYPSVVLGTVDERHQPGVANRNCGLVEVVGD